MKKLLLPVASGFEEVELLSVADLSRRAGLGVTLASVGDSMEVCGAHQITIKTDTFLSHLQGQDFDAIAVHGGIEGVKTMLQTPKLLTTIQEFHASSKLIGAICAAPLILDELGLLQNDFCCYPGCETLMKYTKHSRLNQAVCKQSHIITATGPAFALQFAIQIIQALLDEEIAQKIKQEILL